MTQTLIDRVIEAERSDPARVRPVLQVLVGDTPEAPPVLRPIAPPINMVRRTGALQELIAGSLSTDQVMERLGVRTRQAVHRLRERGRLLGRTVGNVTWFPAWQFTDTGLRSDLADLLAALAEFTTDALGADRIMRLSRPELQARSISEVIDDPGQRELVWHLLRSLGAGG